MVEFKQHLKQRGLLRRFRAMADQSRIQNVLQYALLIAAQGDEWHERSLSPIHLVKYLYLADMDYARHNGGQTFTGLTWTFHHFGPWSADAFLAIDDALSVLDAEKTTFQSQYGERDCVRWSIDPDNNSLERLKTELPLDIKSSVQHHVNRYKNNTTALLHYVYRTEPLLNAAPSEVLDFSVCARPKAEDKEPFVPMMDRLSRMKRKAMQARLDELRSRFKEQQATAKPYSAPPSGRHDAVFEQGVEWLDSVAGEPFPGEGAVVQFADDVWKSEARSGHD